MRYFFLLLATALFSTGCSEEKGERTQKEIIARMEDEYLSELANKGVSELHEEIKWRLYCNHCDVSVKSCMGREMKGLTYGMLDLKVFYLKFDNGRGEIAYTFIANDSMQCPISEISGNKIHGAGFSVDKGALLYFLSAGETEKISLNCDTMVNIRECPTRMLNTDQPVIRKYLNKNRQKLNPWFHMQAVKRGYFED